MKSNLFKSGFFLFAFCALPVMASAQFSLRSIGTTTWIGVRGGASFASEGFTSLPDNSTTSMKIGAIGGLAFEHWFDNNIGVSVDILYDQKGIGEVYANAAANRQNGNVIYSGNDNYSMSYLEIPILLKYSLGRGDIRPYICAGPSIGELLQSSETTTGSVAPLSSDSLKHYLQSTDLSIYAALGVMDAIYQGPILFFEAGYAVGMSSLYKSTPSRITTDGTTFPAAIDPTGAKSGDIRVTVGIMWQL